VSNVSLAALQQQAEQTQSALEDAHKVVVGAVRDLLECSQFRDEESTAILAKLAEAGDEALRDAIALVVERESKYNRVREALTWEVYRAVRREQVLR
jgi:hypothetical protein